MNTYDSGSQNALMINVARMDCTSVTAAGNRLFFQQILAGLISQLSRRASRVGIFFCIAAFLRSFQSVIMYLTLPSRKKNFFFLASVLSASSLFCFILSLSLFLFYFLFACLF